MSEKYLKSDLNEYQCHKKVKALRIDNIQYQDNNDIAFSACNQDWVVTVNQAYMDKFKPEVGGYYVLYVDGYQSYSPAKAFDEGYSLVTK